MEATNGNAQDPSGPSRPSQPSEGQNNQEDPRLAMQQLNSPAVTFNWRDIKSRTPTASDIVLGLQPQTDQNVHFSREGFVTTVFHDLPEPNLPYRPFQWQLSQEDLPEPNLPCRPSQRQWNQEPPTYLRHEDFNFLYLRSFPTFPSSVSATPYLRRQKTRSALYSIFSYEGRLATYFDWPVPFLAKEALAEAGFWYYGMDDYVVCTRCGNGLRNWQSGDDPRQQHLELFKSICF